MLGFFPSSIYLYEEAIRHKSLSKEGENGYYINNERLEFLGDAILNAVIADLLFHQFKTKKEGFLTNTRSKIVQRDTLDFIATEIGLDKLLISSSNIDILKSHVLGNALEALIGAIYLDKNYAFTKIFIEEKVIKPYVNIEKLARKEVNFKSKLLEWCQKNKVNLSFSLVDTFINEDNISVFQSNVTLNGLYGGTGIGHSKKESQQKAAQMAVKKLKTDKEFILKIMDPSKK